MYYKEYQELIKSWCHLKNIHGKEDIQSINTSDLFTLFWSILSLSMLVTKDENNNHIRTCAFALTATITNTSLSITKLACAGLDFQANVLFRNLFETCLLLFSILINREKGLTYFNSAKLNNGHVIWKQNFSMKKLNEEILSFEKQHVKYGKNEKEDALLLSVMHKWRKNAYQYLSAHVHNGIMPCFMGTYCLPDNNDNMALNLLGQKATRIEVILNDMNFLHLWATTIIYKILRTPGTTTKEELTEGQKEFWNEAILIGEMGRLLFGESFHSSTKKSSSRKRKI